MKVTTPKRHVATPAPKKPAAPKKPPKVTQRTTSKVVTERAKDHFETKATASKTKQQKLTLGDKGFDADVGVKNPKLKVAPGPQKALDRVKPKTFAEYSVERQASSFEASGALTGQQLTGTGKLSGGATSLKLEGTAALGGKGLALSGEASSKAHLAAAEGSLAADFGRFQATAGANAQLGITSGVKGALNLQPTRGVYALKAGAETFGGVKAGVQFSATAARYGVLGGSAEAWAGVGGTAQLDVGLKGGKLKLKAQLGASLGIGGSVGLKAEVDLARLRDDGKAALASAASKLDPRWRAQLAALAR